ncbi:hypothetical protein [Pedobacter alluvionis]|nr:hypothetical protein [Pedobacter alluvionis]
MQPKIVLLAAPPKPDRSGSDAFSIFVFETKLASEGTESGAATT